MDIITLILDALGTGAAAAGQATASEAVKDAYHALKTLIQRRFAGKPNAELILSKYEENPRIEMARLKDTLIKTRADRDEEIIEAAQNLMTLLNPQQVAMSKFNAQITGNVQGFVQGDQAQVTMTFKDKPKSSRHE